MESLGFAFEHLRSIGIQFHFRIGRAMEHVANDVGREARMD